MSKPGIDQLLIQSALDADLRERLLESPEQVFQEFDLTDEHRDLLRKPDLRLLPLLGAALARQSRLSDQPGLSYQRPHSSSEAAYAGPAPHAVIQARTLPDLSLALTVVPCARVENGQTHGFSFAVWVNPLPDGADPATLPPPPGGSLPGQPLTPLHAVVKISTIQLPDAGGHPQVGLSASLLQSSNILGPPESPAIRSGLQSEEVQAAVAAVRSAAPGDRYARLINLIQAQRRGDVR